MYIKTMIYLATIGCVSMVTKQPCTSCDVMKQISRKNNYLK